MVKGAIMNSWSRIVILGVALSLGFGLTSCSKSDSASEDQKPAAAAVAKKAVTPPPPPAPPTPYEDEVVKSEVEGGATFDIIKSKSPCKVPEDCTFSKYANAPKSADDCKCAAACTPDVVNKSERDLRKSSNEKYCSSSDWYGSDCPAPPCEFMDFDSFRCVDGVCEGLAAGRN